MNGAHSTATRADAASPGEPAAEPGAGTDLHSASAGATGQLCPNCDTPLPDGALLCTECGFDLVTGERLEGPRGAPQEAVPPAVALKQAFLDFFPGFYYPGIVLLALLCAGLASFLAVFTVFVFGLGAYLSAGAIGVATLAVWTQAVTLMCVGRAEFFNTALGDIEGTQFGVFLGLVLAPPVFVWAFLGWLSSRTSG